MMLVLLVLCTVCCVVDSTPVKREITTTTTNIPTTTPLGCFYNNKFYPPLTVIEKGYDPSSNWCHGTHCDINGQIQYWDDFNCVITTSTTTYPTTVPWCVYNGQRYPIGTVIEKGYDAASNWCYSTYCDDSRQIVHGDNFNCRPTTEVPTTIPNTPPPYTTIPTTTPTPTTRAPPVVG